MEAWMKEVITNENVQRTLIAIGILLLFLFVRKIFTFTGRTPVISIAG